MAAVTNFHKFSDLKQSQLIVLQFWTSEVQNGSHWMKFKVSVGLCSFCRLWGESISLSLPALRGCLHSLAHGPLFHLQSQQWLAKPFSYYITVILPHSHISFSTSPVSLFHL